MSCANVPDILVRNIEEVVADRIKAIARERELSINEVILHVLKQGLGFGGEDIFRREMHDIAVLGGTWDRVKLRCFAVPSRRSSRSKDNRSSKIRKERTGSAAEADQPQPDQPPK